MTATATREIETPLYFPGSAAPLFGVFHEAAEGGRLPFVFCHPFGEEKLWSHRVLVSTARELSRRGHPVLRFDYAGNGDSMGEFGATTTDSYCADIDAAIGELKARSGSDRVGVLGLRLGATLAAQVAERRPDVNRLIAWAPITNGSGYLRDLLRINVTTQLAVYREVREDRETLIRTLDAGGTANVDGYDIGREMSRQLRALTLPATPAGFGGRVLLAHVDRNPAAQPALDLRKMAQRYSDCTLVVVQEEPFWKEIVRFYNEAPNLLRTTLEWLDPQA